MGFASGFDYRATPGSLVGFALAGGQTSYGLSTGLGTGKSDAFQSGAYGSQRFGAAYISGILAYSYHRMTTDRTVTIAGADHLRASFDAHNWGGRIEGGYRLATPVVGITPYGAYQAQWVRGGPGCLNRFSASISGASAGVRLPSGLAAG